MEEVLRTLVSFDDCGGGGMARSPEPRHAAGGVDEPWASAACGGEAVSRDSVNGLSCALLMRAICVEGAFAEFQTPPCGAARPFAFLR